MPTLRNFLPILAAIISSPLLAAPGDLDTSFANGNGWTSGGMKTQPSYDNAYEVIQQQDGKLVVVGDSNSDFVLLRYNIDGTLDSSFDGDGKVITAVGTGNDYGQAVIQQSDGKLVLAGYSGINAQDDIVLIRYNTNGSLDTTFDGDGKVVTSIGTGNDQAYSLIQQTDGKLTVAGCSDNAGNKDFAVVRYNQDGSLDTTFDGDGKVTTAMGPSQDQANALIQQPDGKLVAAGFAGTGVGSRVIFAIARYNSDGSMDTGFNGGGKNTTEIDVSDDKGNALVYQSGGKLVVAGYSYSSSGRLENFALVRYKSDGTLDTTFSGDGIQTTQFGGAGAIIDVAYSIKQQSDGKLVVAGFSGSSPAIPVVARYTLTGLLDTTFSGDGKLEIPVPPGLVNTFGESIIQQSDGKLVVAGHSFNTDIVVIRCLNDGTLDTSFDSGGVLITNVLFTSLDEEHGLVEQSDGKLVVANTNMGLMRYQSNGSLDLSFGVNGLVSTPVTRATAASVIQQNDGKLLVAGSRVNPDNNYADFFFARFNPDGLLDTSFSTVGTLATALSATDDAAKVVIQQMDGKLVAAGYSKAASGLSNFATARYNSDGSLDTTFNGSGFVITQMGMANDYIYDMAQQADGKIVVAGEATVSGSTDIALARYNSNGSLDTSFDGDGKVTTAVGAGIDSAASIIQQTDGKLVIAGSSHNNGIYDFVLVRYNANGSLDTSFDGDGKLTLDFDAGIDIGGDVVQQADGKLVITGRSKINNQFQIAIARVNTDGSVDATFNGDGKNAFSFGPGSHYGEDLLQTRDGKLVIGGWADSLPGGREIILARLESGQLDTDSDGVVDWLDSDNDNDGVMNIADVFPLDATEFADADHDGIGNNADTDDDNDSLPDVIDADPLVPLALTVDGNYAGSAVHEANAK